MYVRLSDVCPKSRVKQNMVHVVFNSINNKQIVFVSIPSDLFFLGKTLHELRMTGCPMFIFIYCDEHEL